MYTESVRYQLRKLLKDFMFVYVLWMGGSERGGGGGGGEEGAVAGIPTETQFLCSIGCAIPNHFGGLTHSILPLAIE